MSVWIRQLSDPVLALPCLLCTGEGKTDEVGFPGSWGCRLGVARRDWSVTARNQGYHLLSLPPVASSEWPGLLCALADWVSLSFHWMPHGFW